MLSIRYKVASRMEGTYFCHIGLEFVAPPREGRSALPEEFREVYGHHVGKEFSLTLPMTEWDKYPIGAELDLVPARTQT